MPERHPYLRDKLERHPYLRGKLERHLSQAQALHRVVLCTCSSRKNGTPHSHAVHNQAAPKKGEEGSGAERQLTLDKECVLIAF
eukprot:1160109-Pelagomonas_calceolata.AAC.6